MKYIGTVAVAAFEKGKSTTKWIERQQALLLDSQIDVVLSRVKKLKVNPKLRKLTYSYLDSNRSRMDCKT
jgi:hypothetical protein